MRSISHHLNIVRCNDQCLVRSALLYYRCTSHSCRRDELIDWLSPHRAPREREIKSEAMPYTKSRFAPTLLTTDTSRQKARATRITSYNPKHASYFFPTNRLIPSLPSSRTRHRQLPSMRFPSYHTISSSQTSSQSNLCPKSKRNSPSCGISYNLV